jgi:hypothetical protein
MNAKRIIYCHLALLIAFTVQASAQQQPSVPVSSSLILTNAIPLPKRVVDARALPLAIQL